MCACVLGMCWKYRDISSRSSSRYAYRIGGVSIDTSFKSIKLNLSQGGWRYPPLVCVSVCVCVCVCAHVHICVHVCVKLREARSVVSTQCVDGGGRGGSSPYGALSEI